MKLLDFIAEPRANDDSTLTEDQVKFVSTVSLYFCDLLLVAMLNIKFASEFLSLLFSMFYSFSLCRYQILGSADEREEVQLRIQRAHTRDLGR
jgi:hypothetical protein